jgi:hypothetical protein
MKLSWNYQGGTDDLWCKVLRGKYEENREQVLEHQVVRGTESSLWKYLVKLNHMLEDFSFWQVGDGTSIDAWSHAWVEEGVYIDQHVIIPNQLHGLKVCNLVTNNREWNWSLFNEWLPTYLQHKISFILPPSMDNGRDEKSAAGDKKEVFP